MAGRVKVWTREGYSRCKTGCQSRIGHSSRDLKKPIPFEETRFGSRIWYTNCPTDDFLAVEAAAHSLLADRRIGKVKEFDATHEEAVAAVQKAMEMVANGWKPPTQAKVFWSEVEELTLGYDVHDLEVLLRGLARRHAERERNVLENNPPRNAMRTAVARQCAEAQAVALLFGAMTKAMGQKVVTVEQAMAWLKSKADAPVNDVS